MQVIRRSQSRPGATAKCAGAILQSLPDLMWFVRRQMRSRRAIGMSVTQFRTLILIQRYPDTDLSAVADKLDMSLPAVSRMVSGLVKKGFAARRVCREDARCMSLVLTSRGEAVLSAAWSGTQAVLAERLASCNATDLTTLERAFVVVGDLFACDGTAGKCPTSASERSKRRESGKSDKSQQKRR